MYIDRLDHIVGRFNKTYKTINADFKMGNYIDYCVANNDIHYQFKAADYIRISKQQNIFAKGYTPNCPVEVFGMKKVENTVP